MGGKNMIDKIKAINLQKEKRYVNIIKAKYGVLFNLKTMDGNNSGDSFLNILMVAQYLCDIYKYEIILRRHIDSWNVFLNTLGRTNNDNDNNNDMDDFVQSMEILFLVSIFQQTQQTQHIFQHISQHSISTQHISKTTLFEFAFYFPLFFFLFYLFFLKEQKKNQNKTKTHKHKLEHIG